MSAALGGLLFVAVSINLERIVALRSLPGAALGTIVLLVAVLMVSTFGLVPGQPHWMFGSEVLVVGLVAWSILTGIWIRTVQAPIPNQPRFVPSSLSGAPWAYRASSGRVLYRSRSRAISAMWWMSSRLLAQMTLMNGSSAASLQGYWQ